MHRRTGRLFHRHRHVHHARKLRGHHIDAVGVEPRVVVLVVLNRIEQFHARRHAVHLRLGIELSHRQVAGLCRAASPNANELPDRGQRATQDRDREEHL